MCSTSLIAYISGNREVNHQKINKYLRSAFYGQKDKKQTIINAINNIHRDMKESDRRFFVYRGIQLVYNWPLNWAQGFKQLREAPPIPFHFSDEGFFSTSKSHIIGYRFIIGKKNPALMVIKIENGVKLIDFDNVYKATKHKDEKEVLLDKGTRFSVVGAVSKEDFDAKGEIPNNTARFRALNSFCDIDGRRIGQAETVLGLCTDILQEKAELTARNNGWILFVNVVH